MKLYLVDLGDLPLKFKLLATHLSYFILQGLVFLLNGLHLLLFLIMLRLQVVERLFYVLSRSFQSLKLFSLLQ